MKKYKSIIILLIILMIIIGSFSGCTSNDTKTREEAIDDDAVKMNPETDVFPPFLHSDEWHQPIPMEGPVNAAGIEDSPFITSDGLTMFFWFTPDPNAPAQEQLIDGVSGIWWCKKTTTGWSEPTRVVLTNNVALDGAPFYQDSTLWFGSVRAGNYGEIDIYTAIYENDRWSQVENAGKQLNKDYDIGEFHITNNGKYLYYDADGSVSKDLYVLEKNDEGWSEPTLLPYPVNTNEYNEAQPFINNDESELWLTDVKHHIWLIRFLVDYIPELMI